VKTIDVHSHFLPEPYLDCLEADGVDPAAEDGFPAPTWSLEEHRAFMDEAGIDFSILTISSPHIHHGNDANAIAAARAINDYAADVCRTEPDRFGFCAVLPTPCVEESVDEAVRSLDTLGALGVKLPSNSCGLYLGNKKLAPLYQALNERNAPVIIHPAPPQQIPGDVFTAGPKPLFEFIGDTTRTVIDLVTSGTLAAYPNVKFVVPHCGSFLPLVAHRLVGIVKILSSNGMVESDVDVLGDIKRLYFDLSGSPLPAGLDALMHITSPDKLLYGSDYPFTPAPQITQGASTLFASQQVHPIEEQVRHANAEALFGL
jgi:6-methylsalicylate decarboxylase